MNVGASVIYCDVESGLEDNLLSIFELSKFGSPSFKYVHDLKAVGYFDLVKSTLEALQGQPDPVIIILDSISYLRPEVESFETVRVGDNIPFFNNFLRAIRPLVGNTNALIIFINGVYQDNENKYNDYKIPGGETLHRACDLVCINYKRQNPANPSANEEHSVEVVSKVFIPKRQKLGIKINKNKWNNCDSTLSKMDYFFNTDNRFGPTGLDNANCMLSFLKLAGALTGQGYYALGNVKHRWTDWESLINCDAVMKEMVITKTIEVLEKIYNGET